MLTVCIGHYSVVRKPLAGRTEANENHRLIAGGNPSRRRHKAHREGDISNILKVIANCYG